MEKRARTVNIMQYLEYLPEEKIKAVLLSYKQIEKWAYIIHDNDKLENGDYKKPHWHIVLKFKTNIGVNAIAGWFGIEPQYVDVPKGRDAFLQCAKYLTHESKKEQEKGKHLYKDNEVKSNFNFRQEIDDFDIVTIKKGQKSSDKKERIRFKVLFEGLKIKDIEKEDYSLDWLKLDACRLKYIKEQIPMPALRLNFYVSGGAGAGKGLISRAIARRLADPDNVLEDYEVFFTVGNGANRFAGYDGQPVIIWNDFRASALLGAFGEDRGAVFNAFDTHPQASQENIKYGSVKLVNAINIVNSVQFFDDFKSELCGDEDINQAHRRFPFFVGLNELDYDLWVNRAFFDTNTREFQQYIITKNIGASFAKIVNAANGNKEFQQVLEHKALLPVATAYKQVEANHSTKEMTKEEQEAIEKEFFKDTQLELELANSEIVESKSKNEAPQFVYSWQPANKSTNKPPFE